MNILLTDEELNQAFAGAFDKDVFFDHKPTPEEIITLRFRAIRDAQLKRVAEWGNEPCQIHTNSLAPIKVKRECPYCWQELIKEAQL